MGSIINLIAAMLCFTIRADINISEMIKPLTLPHEDVIVEDEINDIQKVDLLDLENSGREVLTYGGITDGDGEKIEELSKILNSYPKNISVAAYSLDGSKALIYNGEQEYFSACTIKIPWMLYLCREMDKSTYKKDTVLTYEERHYHTGSGIIRNGEYGDTYTLGKLVKLCLSISDNVAYEMLVEHIGRDAFDAFAEEMGYQSFKLNSWTIWSYNSTVRDYLGIWKDVYEYFETDTECAKLLKESCTNTLYNYGTLTLKDEEYSHKSGDNFGKYCAYNDAGIVWAETPYVYAVFTQSEGELYDINTVNNVMTIIHELF